MNNQEAEEKAREMWGEHAFAILAGPNHYIVGENNGPFKQPYGCGTSWDEAFESAKLNLN